MDDKKEELHGARKCKNKKARIIFSMTMLQAIKISDDLRSSNTKVCYASEKFYKNVHEAVCLYGGEIIINNCAK